MPIIPKVAFILAAGRGKRMQHLTDATPKPLIKVKGKCLIDYVVEKIKPLGIRICYVNLHYCGEQIRAHLAQTFPDIEWHFVWDWCEGLETGGGIQQVIDEITPLAPDGFFVFNSDTIWTDTTPSALIKMQEKFNPKTDDILLLFEPKENVQPPEDGNYFIENGTPRRQKKGDVNIPYLYAGVMIIKPSAFDGVERKPFTVRDLFDKAEQSHKLNFFIHSGRFFHVGTPLGLEMAERSEDVK